MECERCHQVSDWLDESGHWSVVQPSLPAAHPLYECDDCGHRQRAR